MAAWAKVDPLINSIGPSPPTSTSCPLTWWMHPGLPCFHCCSTCVLLWTQTEGRTREAWERGYYVCMLGVVGHCVLCVVCSIEVPTHQPDIVSFVVLRSLLHVVTCWIFSFIQNGHRRLFRIIEEWRSPIWPPHGEMGWGFLPSYTTTDLIFCKSH